MPDKASAAISLIATDLDVNTLFMVTMHVEIMLGLVLYFAWAQNFSKTALAWWGSAHLMRAVSIMLLGMYGSVPDSVSIDLANAVLFGSFALNFASFTPPVPTTMLRVPFASSRWPSTPTRGKRW